jgi:hypothetical protein
VAPTRGTAALLTLLTLAALAPPPAAGSDSATRSAGAIVLSTDRAGYTVGEVVLFTLANQGDAELLLDDGSHLELFLTASPTPFVEPFLGLVPPGASQQVNWATDDKPAGSYYGWLKNATGVVVAIVNDGASWLLEAPAVSAALAVSAGEAPWPAGAPVKFTVWNAGAAELRDDGCAPRLVIRDATGRAVYDSRHAAAVCAGEVALLPGGILNVSWPQADDAGQQVPPGDYVVEAAFGGAAANATFLIVASEPPPPPPEQGVRAIAVHLSSDSVPQGQSVVVWVANEGSADLEGTLSLAVRDAGGQVVYSPASTQVVQTLAAGERLELTWDQRANDGRGVPAGSYLVEARFAELHASAGLDIRAPPPPPPPLAEEGTAPPAGEEPKPVVGRIGASGAGTYCGDYVCFTVDAAARRLLRFQVGGTPLLAELQLPGSGAVAVEPGTGEVSLLAGGVRLTAFDNPSGALRLSVAGGAAEVHLVAAPGVRVTANATSVALRAPGLDAFLVLQGAGRIEVSGSTVSILFDPQQASASVTLRAAAPPPPGPVAEQSARAAADAQLARAIAASKVAAEAFVALSGQGLQVSVVPYAGTVSLQAVDEGEAGLKLTVDVAEHDARTLVFHLGRGVVDADPAHLRVLLDGRELRAADDLADVLDPDDDGLQAEFVVVAGAEGIELLVSVPHFSEHDITVQGALAQLLPRLAPYGLLAGFVMIVAAAALMVRRAR